MVVARSITNIKTKTILSKWGHGQWNKIGYNIPKILKNIAIVELFYYQRKQKRLPSEGLVVMVRLKVVWFLLRRQLGVVFYSLPYIFIWEKVRINYQYICSYLICDLGFWSIGWFRCWTDDFVMLSEHRGNRPL